MTIADTEPARATFLSASFDPWRVVGLFVVATLSITLTGLFAGRWWWLLELAAHFPMIYAAAAALLAAICLVGRKGRLASIALGTLGINLAVILPLYFPPSTGGDDAPTVRALAANVLTGNQQHGRLVEVIRQEQPDILLLSEVDQTWLKAMSPLEVDYPHIVNRTRRDNFGIALYSKLPVERMEVIELGSAGVPSVVARIEHDGRQFLFVGTHPLPPTSLTNSRLRNDQLAALAEFAASENEPLIVMGDLNITPWSPYFRDLLSRGGLENSQHGFGIQATWNFIPLDHALHTREIAIHHRRVGTDFGSDHRPLLVEFSLR